MKRLIILFAAVMLTVTIFYSFKKPQGTVTGKVTPADAVVSVWAVGDTDSTHVDYSNGNFTISAVPGTYKIFVDAKEPYKDATMDNVQIKEGASTDVGEIKLLK